MYCVACVVAGATDTEFVNGAMMSTLETLVTTDVADPGLRVGDDGRVAYAALNERRLFRRHAPVVDRCIDAMVLHATTGPGAPQPAALTEFILAVAVHCHPAPTDAVRAWFGAVCARTAAGTADAGDAGDAGISDADMYTLWGIVTSEKFRGRVDDRRELWEWASQQPVSTEWCAPAPSVAAVADAVVAVLFAGLAAPAPPAAAPAAVADTMVLGPSEFGIDHVCPCMSPVMWLMRRLLTHPTDASAVVSRSMELSALALAASSAIHVFSAGRDPVVYVGGYDAVYVFEDEGFYRVLEFNDGATTQYALATGLCVDIDRTRRTFEAAVGVDASSIAAASAALGKTVCVVGAGGVVDQVCDAVLLSPDVFCRSL